MSSWNELYLTVVSIIVQNICVVWLLFVLFCVLFVCKCVLPPGDNSIAVNKYIIKVIIPPVWNS